MSEILEFELRVQEPIRYDERYVLHIVTELYFYEFVYRFSSWFVHVSFTRETYGKIHDQRSGFIDIERDSGHALDHARKTVEKIERLLEK